MLCKCLIGLGAVAIIGSVYLSASTAFAASGFQYHAPSRTFVWKATPGPRQPMLPKYRIQRPRSK